MTKKSFVAACMLLLSLLGAHAQESWEGSDRKSAQQRLGGDLLIGGSELRIVEPVPGDLIAAGGTLSVQAPVAGNAIVAGGNLTLDGSIGDALYAMGGRITIDGQVAKNARIAGGQVEVDRRAVVGGNLSVAGGDVSVHGEVKGYVQGAGGNVFINGPVGGDVVAAGGEVELGPQARIAGMVRYASNETLRRHPDAQVAGGVRQMGGDWQRERPDFGFARWLWTLGMMVLAVVLVMAAPAVTGRAAGTLRARPGWSLLIGFATLVLAPVAVVVLLVTVIGIPVALLALILYLALLLAGYVMTGIGLGQWLLHRRKGASASAALRVAAAVLGVLLIALLGRIPYVGGFVVLAALLAGLGALVMQLRPGRTQP